MKVFKDIMSGDEMFSDTYKYNLVDEVVYEVQGKLINRKDGEIVGGDAGDEEGVESGIDIVFNHRLVEMQFNDDGLYASVLDAYIAKLLENIKQNCPDQESVFQSNINKVKEGLLGRFTDLQFYTGEAMDAEAMVALMEYRSIGNESVPVMTFFKHGLEEENH